MTAAKAKRLTVAGLRLSTMNALRSLFESNDARDRRIADLAAEVDELHARVMALDARLDALDPIDPPSASHG